MKHTKDSFKSRTFCWAIMKHEADARDFSFDSNIGFWSAEDWMKRREKKPFERATHTTRNSINQSHSHWILIITCLAENDLFSFCSSYIGISELTCKLTMHANLRMLREAALHSVHAAANIFVRHVHVPGGDVALDIPPCCSFPLSVSEKRREKKAKTLSCVTLTIKTKKVCWKFV